jgi:hypothetical protein
MNPLLVTLVPAIFAILLYFSVLAERTLQEIPIEVPIPDDGLADKGTFIGPMTAPALFSEPER